MTQSVHIHETQGIFVNGTTNYAYRLYPRAMDYDGFPIGRFLIFFFWSPYAFHCMRSRQLFSPLINLRFLLANLDPLMLPESPQRASSCIFPHAVK